MNAREAEKVGARHLITGADLGRRYPRAGDTLVALVVAVNADATVDLRVFLDGLATHFVRDVAQAAAATAGAFWPKVIRSQPRNVLRREGRLKVVEEHFQRVRRARG